MSKIGRRQYLEIMGFLLTSPSLPTIKPGVQVKSPNGAGKMKLDLSEFQPKSMLHAAESKVPRSRYPVIDVHTHLSFRAKLVNGVGIGDSMDFLTTPEKTLPVMDRKNVRMMVNLTGGAGAGL